MTPEQLKLADKLAGEVAQLDMSAAECAEFVRSRCGGDNAVFTEVMSLLEQRRTAEKERFLGEPPCLDGLGGPPRQHSSLSHGDDTEQSSGQENLALEGKLRGSRRGSGANHSTGDLGEGRASAGALPEKSIGQYRLLRKLGEGGFGVVYLAEQVVPVRRQVAVKVIKPGMDSAQVLARFEAERQALAVMDHPCIAKVLDGGVTDRGLPYFVMDYAKGEPVTQFCDRHCLSLEQRIEIFIRVCEAVQHAHTKGVIHRDLKPSNILVAYDGDGGPQPKVIDFGVAKALNQRLSEHTIFTEFGQMIGTPTYMSPEQAEMSGLDIDTRSDVYSLGVLLYELLTGAQPIDEDTLRQAGFEAIQRIIREQEPAKPSTRLASILTEQVDEGSTAAKARRLDPHALQRRIRGELDWIVMKCLEKDRSRRYDTAHSLALDLRRYLNHEPVEASPPSVVYQLRKLAQRHRTLVGAGACVAAVMLLAVIGMSLSTALALRERDRANAAQRLATRLAASRNEVIDSYVSVLGRTDPRHMQQLTPIAHMQEIDRLVGPTLRNEPLRHAAVLELIGRSYTALKQFEIAEAKLTEASRLYENELGAMARETLTCRFHLAVLLAKRGDFDEAERALREVLQAQKEAIGPADRYTLATRDYLGCVVLNRDRIKDAEEIFRATHADAESTLGENHRATLRYMDHVAQALDRQDHTEEADAIFQDVLARRREHLGESDPDTLISLNGWAGVLYKQKRYAEAEKIVKQVLAANRKVYGDCHLHVAAVLGNLAQLLQAQKEYSEASVTQRESLAIFEELYGPEHHYVARHQVDLAELLHEYRPEGWLDEARGLADAALQTFYSKTPDSTRDISRAEQLLADIQQARKEP